MHHLRVTLSYYKQTSNMIRNDHVAFFVKLPGFDERSFREPDVLS
jgi:hypothetical protein